ncbi:MAG: gluconate 2-dehydrogenase subunit 3 family protein [Gammaproteobacteria bacterium]|jgi:hypothetical protein
MTDRGGIIGSDSPLPEAQRATLDAVLNLIIPPSDDGRMPGAVDVDVLKHIRDAASGIIPILREELERLDDDAKVRFGNPFASLVEKDRATLFHEARNGDPTFMQGLVVETLTCYYRDDRVLEAIGMEPRPPYPKGYDVESGDLSLLDPVIARGKKFRDAQ